MQTFAETFPKSAIVCFEFYKTKKMFYLCIQQQPYLNEKSYHKRYS